jgi:hypothetical protein
MKNTILSVIRHLLTAGGAYLVAKGKLTEVDASAISGAVLAILGLVWGATDEHIAENKS